MFWTKHSPQHETRTYHLWSTVNTHQHPHFTNSVTTDQKHSEANPSAHIKECLCWVKSEEITCKKRRQDLNKMKMKAPEMQKLEFLLAGEAWEAIF